MKILCIEDDEGLAVLLRHALVKQHYQLDVATDGLTGWDLAEIDTYDLILLDWILPELTGLEFCQRLRTGKHSTVNPNRNTPVLLMTAMDAVTHKVMGLNAGADDYVVKPFEVEELVARIHALLRRVGHVRTPWIDWGAVRLNPDKCEVSYQGQPLALATKEYELLELFLRNTERIFSPARLLTALWPVEEMPGEGTVRAHIKGLRQKLKRAGADDPIETLYKLGYRLKPPSEGERQIGKVVTDSPASVPPLFTPSSVPPELQPAWREARPLYLDRLSNLRRAIADLEAGTLTPEKRRAAERESHTLAGSLGSFGLEGASELCRQIQKIFGRSDLLERTEIETLRRAIEALRSDLEHPEDGENLSDASSGWLLIVDTELSRARSVADEALGRGFRAEIAKDFESARYRVRNSAPTVLLLDLDRSEPGQSGLEFLATVHREYPALALATLTSTDSLDRRVTATRAGSLCFLTRPIDAAEILTAIVSLGRRSTPPRECILIVDDDPDAPRTLETPLTSEGHDVTLLDEPKRFWHVLERRAPDLLILAVEFRSSLSDRGDRGESLSPPLSGIDLCRSVRADPRWNSLPVIFLSSSQDSEMVERCFSVGADDVLDRPPVDRELVTRARNRLERRKRSPLNPPDTIASEENEP